MLSKHKNYILIIFTALLVSCSNSKEVQSKNNYNAVISNSDISEITSLGSGWFNVVESVEIKNITPEEAKQEAIQKALKKAIEYYSGVEVNARTTDLFAENQDKVLLDNFASITTLTSRGIIVEKELIKENIISDGNYLTKVVTLKVKVEKQEGAPDPSFKITANLNKDNFITGEELKLTVKSSKDCYLTIFNVGSNDSVYVVFPNKYREDNFLNAGEIFLLPSKKDNDLGIIFTVSSLNEKKEDSEMIKIIATREKIDFASIYSSSAYGTSKSTFLKLQKWLVKIPRNEIEEIDLQYFISK